MGNPLKNKTIPPNANAYTASIIHALPKSPHYREPLENLIGSEVILEGSFSTGKVSLIPDFGVVSFLCIENIHVKSGATTIGTTDKKSAIDHMWIICDADYIQRNGFQEGEVLRCKGTLYEYSRNGTDRNISMILKKVSRPSEDELILPTIPGASKHIAKEVALITEISKSEQAVRERKKLKKDLEIEALAALESFIEEHQICEFCDLSHEVRNLNPKWYKVVVKNAAYLENFINSVARKSNDSAKANDFLDKYRKTGEVLTKEAGCRVDLQGLKLNLNNTEDESLFRHKLHMLVTSFMNNVNCKHPEDQIYIVGDGTKFLSVLSSARTPLAVKGMGDFRSKYKFLDVCFFVNNKFNYVHYDVN